MSEPSKSVFDSNEVLADFPKDIEEILRKRQLTLYSRGQNVYPQIQRAALEIVEHVRNQYRQVSTNLPNDAE